MTWTNISGHFRRDADTDVFDADRCVTRRGMLRRAQSGEQYMHFPTARPTRPPYRISGNAGCRN